MSDEVLQEEEIEFLLNETRGSNPHEDTILPGDGEITMRGDLDKIELADIFQTLALSKMEGQLRIRSLIDQHEIFFSDGYVRSIPPHRTEIKRIGQRLLQASMLTIEQLRAALLVQKRDNHRQLGEILVAEQFVTPTEIEDVFHNQVQEDLFALFTWRQGTFEFYRGPCQDAELLGRLEQTPRFEVNGVLLEVARRGDEWARVMNSIRDLDEVLEVVPDIEPEEPFQGEFATVIQAIDGRRNVRALADYTALGLFHCGCVLRDLTDAGYLQPITTDTGLAVAAAQCDNGELKLATVTYHMLRQRAEAHPIETATKLASGLQRCGETRWAARVLVAAARAETDVIEALKIARFARKCAGRMPEVLRFLQRLLRETGADPQELLDVTGDLADALAQDGNLEEALDTAEELEELAPGSPFVLSRKAKLLARLERNDAAVETLLELAEHCKADDSKDRLAATYEQILKLDHRRKDVRRALAALRASKAAIWGRRAACAAVAFCAAAVGWVQLASARLDSKLTEIAATIEAKIAAGQMDEAAADLKTARAQYSDSSHFEKVGGILLAYHRRETESDRESQEQRWTAALAKADLAISAGDLAQAIGIYHGLGEFGHSDTEVRQVISNRLQSILTRLVSLRSELETKLPPIPNLLQSQSDRLHIVEDTRLQFLEQDRKLALSVQSAQNVKTISRHLESIEREQIQQAAKAVVRLFVRCDTIVAEHTHELQQTRVAQRLGPLYQAARRYENEHDFNRALDAYRRLSQEHPEDDELKAGFRERVERYSTILRFMKVLQDATSAGEFATAQGQLRALQQSYPSIPFNQLAELPIRIISVPPGATVRIRGETVGKTPLLTRYSPGLTTAVQIDLDGFHTERTEFEGDEVSRVQSLLAKQPDWSIALDHVVEVEPMVDAKGRTFVVDRRGRLTAIDGRGRRVLWRYETQDLSGLLPRPVGLASDRIAVASIDGKLRCHDATSGTPIWESKNLPVEVGPVALSGVIVVATTDQRLVGIDHSNGKELFSKSLPGTVRASLAAGTGDLAIAATRDGVVLAVHARSGEIEWQNQLEDGVLVEPVVCGDGTIIIVTSDGTIHALEGSTGRARWRRSNLDGNVESRPTPRAARNSLLLTYDDRLLELNLTNGVTHRKRTLLARATTPVRIVGKNIVVGLADRSYDIRSLHDLETDYLLRGSADVVLPVSLTPGTTSVIAVFGDGSLQHYDFLPHHSDG